MLVRVLKRVEHCPRFLRVTWPDGREVLRLRVKASRAPVGTVHVLVRRGAGVLVLTGPEAERAWASRPPHQGAA